MKFLIASVLIAIAIVANVSLLPTSRWVFMNQLDMAAGGVPASQGNFTGMIDAIVPSWITKPETYQRSNAPEQLARAVLTDYPERNRLLVQFTKDHPENPMGWAVLARIVCTLGGRTPDDPNPIDAASLQNQKELFSIGQDACTRGASLEPDNAYFPYVRAAFDMYLNQPGQMDRDLAMAAQMRHYDGHLREWSASMQLAIRSAKGYRGEMVRLAMDASLLLPDLAKVKSLGRFINRHGSLQEKRNLIQVQNLICRQSEVMMEGLVALANVRSAIREPLPIDSWGKHSLTDAQWTQLATGFDAKLRSASITTSPAGTLNTYQSLDRYVKASQKYLDSLPGVLPQTGGDDGATIRLFFRTTTPYIALSSLLLSLPFSALAWGFSRVKGQVFQKMLPHLLCLPSTLIPIWLTPHDGSLPASGLVLGGLQLAISFFHVGKGAGPKRSQIVYSVGACLAIVSFLFPDRSGGLGGVVYLLVAGLTLMTQGEKTRRFSHGAAIVLFILVTLVAGGVFSWVVMPANLGHFGLAPLLIGICGAALFAGRPVEKVRIAASASLLVFSGLYLVSTGVEVRGNNADRMSHTSLTDESDSIRRMAGIR